ncbi:MAG TPA: gamma-glutamylcyclotransferase family protein [Gemmatimonadaceae bacterium]|jgi:hypothetical protein|nr:gamma-glutamylcyclotransferase family protein [Gemmatimonadaceae bacterium]
MALLFSYGTLRVPETQLAVFGREVAGSVDELLGFTRRTVQVRDASFAASNGAVQAIVRETGRDDDRIAGTVLEVTDAELAMADAYEPAGYRRIAARFASGRRGWVYAEDE